MPEETHIFDKIFETMPTTLEAIKANNQFFDGLVDTVDNDLNLALDKIDWLEANCDEIGKEIVVNATYRLGILMALATFETLHLIREKLGEQAHPFTLTPQILIEALAKKTEPVTHD